MDEAYNPVNYLRWFRANPDFPLQYSSLACRPRSRIPLNRAILAIFLVALTLIAEGSFFCFSLSTAKPLTLSQLQLSVNQTNTPEKGRTIKVNNTGRVTLSAVFAFYNQQSGTARSVSGSLIRQTITRTH